MDVEFRLSKNCDTRAIDFGLTSNSFLYSFLARFVWLADGGVGGVCTQGEFKGIHFHQGHYEAMGHSLCEVLLHLVDPDQTKVEDIVQKLKDK